MNYEIFLTILSKYGQATSPAPYLMSMFDQNYSKEEIEQAINGSLLSEETQDILAKGINAGMTNAEVLTQVSRLGYTEPHKVAINTFIDWYRKTYNKSAAEITTKLSTEALNLGKESAKTDVFNSVAKWTTLAADLFQKVYGTINTSNVIYDGYATVASGILPTSSRTTTATTSIPTGTGQVIYLPAPTTEQTGLVGLTPSQIGIGAAVLFAGILFTIKNSNEKTNSKK